MIEDQFQRNSMTRFVVAGDFNLVINPDVDSIGRQQTRDECLATNKLKEIMTKYSLMDSYREINKWGGFTWGRDNPVYLRSRLDMIIVSKSLKQNIKESHTYKTCESDHHFLHLSLIHI